MRRWFVLLMIVLLPLRAAAGDLMALGMALADQPAVAAGMSPDCPMHNATADGVSTTDDSAAPKSADGCGSCALCLPVAEVPSIAVVGAHGPVHARPSLGDARYLSATARGLLRPPQP